MKHDDHATRETGPMPDEARRLCYFAHYDTDPVIADHVIYYLAALRRAGFRIVLGTPCRLDDAERAKVDAIVEAVMIRENVGMDFGTWIDLLDRYPPGTPDLILICNDSVYAPVGDLDAFLDELLSHAADFYGAVASGENTPHLQSWFMLFRPAAYTSPAFAELFKPGSITADTSKTDVVDRFEMGLTAKLVQRGLRFHAAYDWRRDSGVASSLPFNPTHLLWDELVLSRLVPFIKIELLRYNPASVPGVDRWRDLVDRFAPALTPLIEADLGRRRNVGASTPIVRPPSLTRLKGAPDPIYRRQLRPMIVRDFRAARARARASRGANALMLKAAWHYSRLGRIVKWAVIDTVSGLSRRLRRAG